ncbi:hypothetical protein FXF51_26035 [Nonomuraea sp. PA05]|uniref:hypothetical protein n=1 Tax=Nonomuraea sp. PA05 TaxID=2604466 RepID=UPI0011D61019|nr:hypothetical protein [Nonomuraea sp. PA05]TYB62184.1 hypothetical protein FXF51_26035 [Nonomuraea sp. PA05]
MFGDFFSYGVAQLEPYKVQLAWWTYKRERLSTKEAVAKLLNPDSSIEAAALYMRYLHANITVKTTADGGGYQERGITWAETAVAYCGCSGVTMSASTRDFGWKNFVTWIETGKLSSSNEAEAIRRYNAMHQGWADKAAGEYWECANDDKCVLWRPY